jgi:hypothetical protein
VGWETRQRGGQYYYRTARINGQPRRIYLGSGPIGRIHELLDRHLEREKLAASNARLQLESQLAEMDTLWAAAWNSARTLATAFMLTAGYYSHHGTWRRIMGKPRTRQRNRRLATPQEGAELRAQLTAINARANAGEPGALKELKEFLDDHPEVWTTLGDVNRLSIDKWAGLIANKDALHQESLVRSIDQWKNDLIGPNASPTEKALAETAAVARLALSHAECMATTDTVSIHTSGIKIKRLNAAQHRFTNCLKTLAQVRSAYPTGLAATSESTGSMPRLYVGSSRRKKAG